MASNIPGNVPDNAVSICCAPSSDMPGLKTGLPHLLTKPWSEVGALVLRLGRLEDGAGGQKMGQGQKLGHVLKS